MSCSDNAFLRQRLAQACSLATARARAAIVPIVKAMAKTPCCDQSLTSTSKLARRGRVWRWAGLLEIARSKSTPCRDLLSSRPTLTKQLEESVFCLTTEEDELMELEGQCEQAELQHELKEHECAAQRHRNEELMDCSADQQANEEQIALESVRTAARVLGSARMLEALASVMLTSEDR
jgi:hypothetical protein